MDPRTDSSRMALGPDDSVWITTSSYGNPMLLRFLPKGDGGEWITYDERDNLAETGEYDFIAFTGDGDLWLGYRYGNLLYRCKILP